jgi:alanine-glyoxylate transaminase/serine-glyoxylate transaminase/serine-pyruvate transaminase
MIPGPTEFHEEVLQVLGEPSPSHVAPSFIQEFGDAIRGTRGVLLAPTAQPFIITGSGSLGWDMIVANLAAPGAKALVVNTGYFSDSFADCCTAYRVSVDHVHAPAPGETVDTKTLEEALTKDTYNLVCLTQVDTSTGVRNNIAAMAAAIRKVLPDAFIAVDGVCSFAAEEFRFDDWGIDAAMTGSQKALGVPPGLAVMAFSQRAVDFALAREHIGSYYANIKNWLPIMKAYEAGRGSYFATPNVNLIRSLNVACKRLLATGMENVFKAHREAADALRAHVANMGLTLVPKTADIAANTLSAIRYPGGSVVPGELLGNIKKNGAIVAGGLHRVIKAEYFRVGHMGISVTEPGRNHMEQMHIILEKALRDSGHVFPESYTSLDSN